MSNMALPRSWQLPEGLLGDGRINLAPQAALLRIGAEVRAEADQGDRRAGECKFTQRQRLLRQMGRLREPNHCQIAIRPAESLLLGTPLAVDLGQRDAFANLAQRAVHEILTFLQLRHPMFEFERVRDGDRDVELTDQEGGRGMLYAVHGANQCADPAEGAIFGDGNGALVQLACALKLIFWKSESSATGFGIKCIESNAIALGCT